MKLSTITAVFVMTFLASGTAYSACYSSTTPLTKPSTIYAVNGNGTVTDAETGLMWQQCSLGLSGATCATGTANTYTWKAALEAAQTANGGAGTMGYTDWRLPSVAELRTLVEKSCLSPGINSAVFPATLSNIYWTSSPYAGLGTTAWFVHFTASREGGGNKSSAYYVRLVRGGQ